jgi:hypothetical protein
MLIALAPEAGLALASPVDALIAAKQTTQVYYATDSHWTEPGAYEGYRTLIEGLRAQGLDVDLLPRERLERSGVRNNQGDLYGLLGVENAPAQAVPAWRIRSPAQILHEEGIPAYDWQGVKAVRWTSSKTAAPRLLVFGDSYFNSMRPYLLESFSSVAYLHHRAGAPPLEVLDACDYDAVALEMVERMLNHEFAPAR